MRADLSTPFVRAEITALPGEVVAVVGPNGAGKTSLLRALAGLLEASGTFELGGRQVGHLPPHARRVGWLPQAPSLFAHLSARDNAAYSLRTRGVRRSAARAAAQDWLTRLGIGDLGDALPAALSGGQVARVALARAARPVGSRGSGPRARSKGAGAEHTHTQRVRREAAAYP